MNMYDDKLSLSLKVKEFLKSSLKFKEKNKRKIYSEIFHKVKCLRLSFKLSM